MRFWRESLVPFSDHSGGQAHFRCHNLTTSQRRAYLLYRHLTILLTIKREFVSQISVNAIRDKVTRTSPAPLFWTCSSTQCISNMVIIDRLESHPDVTVFHCIFRVKKHDEQPPGKSDTFKLRLI